MNTSSDNKKIVRYFSQPLWAFVRHETFSSLLLLICVLIAMFCANSPIKDQYFQLWNNTYFTIGFDYFNISKNLLHWINDGLMAIFFFVIGLEIKREMLTGELQDLKKATLPIFAALGGMVVPILFFIALNYNQTGIEGWGIPMATDIALSLGILKLLGKRVPLSLKIFLTVFAIADDIGAVLIIGIFYNMQIHWILVLSGIGFFLLLLLLNYLQIRYLFIYGIIGILIWVLFLKSGLHPTLAGVLVAFTIPAKRGITINYFKNKIQRIPDLFSSAPMDKIILSPDQQEAVKELENLSNKVQSPMIRIENRLHKVVAYFIMPIFTLANAGVTVINSPGIEVYSHIAIHIGLALLIGKIIGISFFSWVAIRLKWASLPKHTTFRQVIGVGFLGGIGFTMSIFIAGLAYPVPSMLNASKIGIIVGSLVAGISGYIVLYFSSSLKKQR